MDGSLLDITIDLLKTCSVDDSDHVALTMFGDGLFRSMVDGKTLRGKFEFHHNDTNFRSVCIIKFNHVEDTLKN